DVVAPARQRAVEPLEERGVVVGDEDRRKLPVHHGTPGGARAGPEARAVIISSFSILFLQHPHGVRRACPMPPLTRPGESQHTAPAYTGPPGRWSLARLVDWLCVRRDERGDPAVVQVAAGEHGRGAAAVGAPGTGQERGHGGRTGELDQ